VNNKKGKKKGEKFIKEDHSDANMLVAIRVRPINQRELALNDIEITRTEDKLLVSAPPDDKARLS